MTYSVKEIYYTLQGEGAQAGRPAIFCRFTGCNLWSGLEKDRARAVCQFCDTDFIGTDGPGGGKFESAEQLGDAILAAWPEMSLSEVYVWPYIVFTGGEPLLQLDAPLISYLKQRGAIIAVETNGTIKAPDGLDWICVSPKQNSELVQLSGHELKLVYPQDGCDPAGFTSLAFEHFFLQPMDGDAISENVEAVIAYCKGHPKWRLSLQTHKLIGIP